LYFGGKIAVGEARQVEGEKVRKEERKRGKE